MKEVDDVLGGAAAWENVDSCDEKVNVDKFAKPLFFRGLVILSRYNLSHIKCPKCENLRAYFMQIQTR